MKKNNPFNIYYVGALKRYFDFQGRTGKKAYWMFVLFNILISWVAIAVDNILGTADAMKTTIWGINYGAFYNFYGLVLLIPGLAIAVRRLHDTGRKWTYMFMLLIPIYGWIWMLIQLIKEGDPVDNEFGPVPVDEEYKPEGHPYAPNESSDAGSDKQEASNANFETVKPVKPKNEKKPKLRDRGAVDFTYHSKEKRKT